MLTTSIDFEEDHKPHEKEVSGAESFRACDARKADSSSRSSSSEGSSFSSAREQSGEKAAVAAAQPLDAGTYAASAGRERTEIDSSADEVSIALSLSSDGTGSIGPGSGSGALNEDGAAPEQRDGDEGSVVSAASSHWTVSDMTVED
jgi:hypothetical protein